MRCRHCLHLLQPSTMDAGVFVSVHGARCSNETGHRVAYPWFEVRGSVWHDDVPSMRDLVVHSSAEHSSVWSLKVSDLLDLLEVLTASLSHDPEERSFLMGRLADAMRFLRDSTPYPLPDEEIGHHRREALRKLEH